MRMHNSISHTAYAHAAKPPLLESAKPVFMNNAIPKTPNIHRFRNVPAPTSDCGNAALTPHRGTPTVSPRQRAADVVARHYPELGGGEPKRAGGLFPLS